MFPILLLLFIAMPIIEISLLLQVGDAIGGLNTVVLVILTAVIGASLVKSQGMQTWFEVNRRMQSGELPGQQIVEGLLLLVAGVLLVTPGFVTDLFGIIVVTPFLRPVIAKSLMKNFKVKMVQQPPFQQQSPFDPPPSSGEPGKTIEGEYERKDKE